MGKRSFQGSPFARNLPWLVPGGEKWGSCIPGGWRLESKEKKKGRKEEGEKEEKEDSNNGEVVYTLALVGRRIYIYIYICIFIFIFMGKSLMYT